MSVWFLGGVEKGILPKMPMPCKLPHKPQAYFATMQLMGKDLLPTDYHTFLHTIKTRIQQAQLKAAVAVNTELILLY